LIPDAIAGFALGFSLIIAVGAQNAFVLRQGLLKSHVFAVCLICSVSDLILIVVGVTGFGALATAVPGLELGMRLFGAAFLIWYALRTLWAAWKGGQQMETGQVAGSLKAAVLTCLALTWLNPHVYLDTVMVLGAVSAQYDNKFAFGGGATLASFLYFFALGYGARLLAPIFAKPRAWQVLDVFVGLTMLAIAIKLLLM
jgi:L-lysine exporter family protein LysE/ArgO